MTDPANEIDVSKEVVKQHCELLTQNPSYINDVSLHLIRALAAKVEEQDSGIEALHERNAPASDKILAGLQDALAFAKGDVTKATVTTIIVPEKVPQSEIEKRWTTQELSNIYHAEFKEPPLSDCKSRALQVVAQFVAAPLQAKIEDQAEEITELRAMKERILEDAEKSRQAEYDAGAKCIAELEAKLVELGTEASFLCARLDELEFCSTDQSANDFYGHVMPSLSRLKKLLAEDVSPLIRTFLSASLSDEEIAKAKEIFADRRMPMSGQSINLTDFEERK